MPLNGQSSGDWTESSSALRILYAGVRNTAGATLTEDAFTQTNPPVVATAGTVSTQVDTRRIGVLSGSVCFARPDVGEAFVGGPVEGLPAAQQAFVRPLGVFINSAAGNAYENLPGIASGQGPYVSSQGTYGNQLFETQVLDGPRAAGAATGDDIGYTAGQSLIASRNGFLMASDALVGGALVDLDDANCAAEVASGRAASTVIGIVKMAPDSQMNELVYDQRI